MADKRLFVQIDVKNNAGRVFQEIGRDAQQMARLLEQAADGASDGIENIDDAATDASQALDRLDRAQQDAAAAAQRVERSSTEAATALDRVDTAATEAGRAVEQVADSSESAGRSMRDFSDAGQTVATGLGLIGGAFTMYAQQARESEIATATLTRTYGEAAQSFLALADQVQATTIFSNDQVVEAANLMGTLSRNFDFTNEQIQQLITVSADLAAVTGISLADASQRVAAAMRGEAESAELLGLTLNDRALGIDRMAQSTSDAERAQVRYNALLEQSAFAQGAAADQTDDLTGKTQQLANRIQDAATSFVEMTGPIGEVVGGLGAFGLEAGLALAGTVQLARGLRELSAASAGVGRLGTAFGLLTNPITLVGVAVAGMTAVAIKNIAEHDDAAKELAATYEDVAETIRNLPLAQAQQGQVQGIIDGVKALDDAYAAMFERIAQGGEFQQQFITDTTGQIQQQILTSQAMADQAAAGILTLEQEQQAINLISEALQAQGANVNALIPAMENAIAQHQLWIETNGRLGISGDTLIRMLQDMATNADTFGESIQRTTNELLTFSDQITVAETAIEGLIRAGGQDFTLIDSLIEMQPVIDGIIRSITEFTRNGDLFWGLTTGSDGLTQLENDLNAVLTTTGVAGAYAQEAVENLNEAHQAGIINADQYAAAIHYLAATELPALQNELTIVAYQIGRLVDDMDNGGAAAEDLAAALGLASVEALDFGKNTDLAADSTRDHVDQLDLQIAALDRLAAAFGVIRPELNEWVSDQVALNDALGVMSANMGTLPQRLNETAVAVERVNRAIGITATEVERGQDLWTAYNDAVSDVVETFGLIANASTVTNILKETSNTILGQTNAWGSAAESVADWAGSLAHGQLAQTRLDQALLDGIISRKTYQEALEANHQIQVANAEIQEDILRIQIKQMPVMAQVIQQQAEYIDGLADQDTASQLVALGYMDQAQSAKALEVAQLAAASATDAQKASTTAMIAEMVAADPVLKAMLLDMGIISEGADGTITVNFGDAELATEAIEALNGTINDLILLLGDIFNVDTDTDAPDTQALITNLIGEIGKIPREVVTNVFLNDYASLKASEVNDILNLLDGKTVTTYINTVQTGSLSLNNPFAATGATITPDIPLTTRPLPSYGSGGTHAVVGEYGRELVWLPNGAQVTPAGATESRLQAMGAAGGGGRMNFYAPITIQPASVDLYDALSSAAIRRGRS